MIIDILMFLFKTFHSKQQIKSTERQKTSFSKEETVENADLHKAILNKTMTTQG